ncbi:hypothetical protein IOQ59_14545 [Pontibacterium sp. N1Y112]|uniref:Uncharacterized protein n=1 Tax=Pontibacterium sinense TaxID=2781979 RepID=A0A8J7FCG0_9GAMM|nr:hypothetical protein [Pontibacterium sinense]MBE9398477.1 hypothetical protein [Pontibacterium sinense]
MSQFKVVLQNTIAEGFNHEEVERNLARFLKTDDATVKKLITRRETVIKKGVESDVAEKYRKLLDKCGVGCEIRPMLPTSDENKPLSDQTNRIVQAGLAPSEAPKSSMPSLILTDLTYDQVPFYRKWWFIVLAILLFSPASFLICLTGNIYAKKRDGVYKYSRGLKWLVIFISFVFIFKAVVHQLG